MATEALFNADYIIRLLKIDCLFDSLKTVGYVVRSSVIRTPVLKARVLLALLAGMLRMPTATRARTSDIDIFLSNTV
jgi:hypothetical protein